MDIRSFAEEIFEENPTRFNKKEKQALQEKAKREMLAAGWKSDEIRIQKFKGLLGSQNMIIGNPEEAEYFVTGHYDTPARNGWLLASASILGQTGANILYMILFIPSFAVIGMIVGNIMGMFGDMAVIIGPSLMLAIGAAMIVGLLAIKNKNNRNDNTSGTLCVLDCAARAAADPELRKKCCFILFDNEEWGLVGSSQFAGWCIKNKFDLKQKTVINLDCVGVGDYLCAAHTGRRNKKQAELFERLRKAGLELTEKRSSVVYLSDHANFRNSCMLCYCGKSKIGTFFIPNIHMSKDKECDVDKVDDLAEKIMTAVR